MRIYIKSDDGHSFSLPLPLVMLKSRLLWNLIEKHSDKDVSQYAPIARAACGALADYVRTHGHFVLVDVQSAGGEFVKIVV